MLSPVFQQNPAHLRITNVKYYNIVAEIQARK